MSIIMFNYILFIIVNYITCMIYFLREITTVIKIIEFNCFSYIAIAIGVSGITFINNGIINKLIIRFFRF